MKFHVLSLDLKYAVGIVGPLVELSGLTLEFIDSVYVKSCVFAISFLALYPLVWGGGLFVFLVCVLRQF